jgi:hypothetical protein
VCARAVGVSTLAGGSSQSALNSACVSSTFQSVSAVVSSGSDNLWYVVDAGNAVIRSVTTSGTSRNIRVCIGVRV